ncbi:MAG: glycerophosphodiester phosphodiesterase, partial [Polyangiales bacterium]
MRPFRFERSRGARPLVYGHRGARAHAPENTLESFARAMDDGADGIELDVRTSRDGVVVVVHDPDLRRVTEGRDLRKAQDLSSEELGQVELSGGARIPTLESVLDWADSREALVNVELKHDTHDKHALTMGVARLLRGRTRQASRTLFSSFDPELLARIALLLPSVPRAFLFNGDQRFARTAAVGLIARAVGATMLHPERVLCSPARVARFRERYLVNVWTVNDEREASDLARLGV